MKTKRKRRKFIYSKKSFIEKIAIGTYYGVVDLHNKWKNRHNREFPYYGIRIFFGKQGAGKSTSAVSWMKEIKQSYPNCKIYSNIDIDIMDGRIDSIDDILNYRNGSSGIIFFLDEISALFDNSLRMKDMPSGFLQEITQQRKQRILIIGTAQSYLRTNILLREQTFECVRCHNWFGRFFFNVAYDAEIYERYHQTAVTGQERAKKLKRSWRRWYVADNALYNSFESYGKVERIWEAFKLPSKKDK